MTGPGLISPSSAIIVAHALTAFGHHAAHAFASVGSTGTATTTAATSATTKGATTTTAAKAGTSSSSYILLFVFVALIGFYFLFIRPRSQQARRQQQAQTAYEIGDRVLTRAGIVGTVVGFVGDRVQLEVAQGVVIEVVKQGLGQRLPDSIDSDDDDDEDALPPPPGYEDDELDEDDDESDEDDDADADGVDDSEDHAVADMLARAHADAGDEPADDDSAEDLVPGGHIDEATDNSSSSRRPGKGRSSKR
jgi:preprotein translocase subunit YajC